MATNTTYYRMSGLKISKKVKRVKLMPLKGELFTVNKQSKYEKIVFLHITTSNSMR